MKRKVFQKVEKMKEKATDVVIDAYKEKKSQTYAFRFFKHPIFVGVSFLGATLFFLPLFLLAMVFLPEYTSEKKTFIFLLVLAFLLITTYANFYIFWRINSYLISKDGLFVFRLKHIFFLETEMIPLEKMSTFDMDKKGFWAAVWGYGNIILASLITDKSLGTATIFLKNIWHPKKVLQEIQKTSKNYSNQLIKTLENDVIDSA